MQAKDLMTTDVVSVSMETTLAEVAKIMVEKKISGLPVVNEDGKVVGVLSESDMMDKEFSPKAPSFWELFVIGIRDERAVEDYRARIAKHMAKTAGEIMTKSPVVVDELESVAVVAQIMMANQVKRVLVTRMGEMVGIISRFDFVRLMVEKR